MTEKQRSKLARVIDRFLNRHKGHFVEAPKSEAHYVNLWCRTCERGLWGKGKGKGQVEIVRLKANGEEKFWMNCENLGG